jgi:hypothetical protein
MTEITIHQGDEYTKVNLDWTDHNNIKQKDFINIKMTQTKPYTLLISINGVEIANIKPRMP